MEDNKVEIKVTADTAQAVSGLASVEGGIKRTGGSAQELSSSAGAAGKGLAQVGQGGEVAATGLGKARKGVESISEQLNVAKTQIAAFISAQLGLGVVKSVAATADEYTNLQASIKLATGEGKNFTEAFDQVVGIAQRTSSSLVQTGTLFTRVAEAGKSAGLTTEAAIAQSLRLTETINQAVQLSGGSAESSNAAVTQLIQGLQSGVLRGEEFNSVMEQAPRLAKALADGLGTTTGELRKMAEAGSLSSDVVIRALKGQSDTLKAEFATLPATVARAIENLSTSWTLYIGDTDKATGASATAASAIKLLSDNLSTVAGYLIDAGQAAAGFGVAKLAQSFFGVATAAAQTGVAVVASTAATVGNTIAQQTNAAAVTQNAAAAARAAGSTSLLTQATYVNTAGTTTNTAAQVAAALAVGKTGEAADAAGAGVGRFSALLGTIKLFGLVGIVTNYKDIGVAIGEAAAKLLGYKDRTEELARAEKVSASIAAEGIALRERQTELNRAALDAQFELTLSARKSVDEFTKLTKEGTSAGDAIAKIGKDFDLASSPGIANAAAVLDKLVADGKLTATQFQKAWADALKGADLAVFETQARAALSGTAREAERLAQIMDASLREAIKRTGLDFDVIAGGMGKASRSAINDTDAIVKGLDSLKKQSVDTGQVLTASIGKSINAADSQKAIDQVKAQIESLRKVLGDKLTDGLLDQAKQKALELKDALDKAKPGVNSLREAMAELGLKSRDELQATANKATEAYSVITKAGQQEGESYVGWQARKTSAAQTMIERVLAANNGVATEALKVQAAIAGLELSIDSAGKTAVKAMGDAASATDGAGGAASRAAGGFDELANAANRAAQAQSGGGNSALGGFGGGPKAGSRERRPGEIRSRFDDGEEAKSVLGNTREERLAGQAATDGSGAYALRAKQKAGTLSADDLRTAEAVYTAAAANKEIYDQNQSAFSLDGARSILTELNSARTILEEVRAKQAAASQRQAAPAAQQSSQPAAQQPGSSSAYLVKLDFGNGRTQNINVASANDAQTLIAALQQAKSAAGF